MAAGCKFLLLCLWVFSRLTNLSDDDKQVQGDARNVFLMSGQLLPLRSSSVAAICTFKKSALLRPWQRYRPALIPPLCYWLLLLAGDVEANPGPVKFPCGSCSRPVKVNQAGVQCDVCDYWLHKQCISMTDSEYESLQHSDEPWAT